MREGFLTLVWKRMYQYIIKKNYYKYFFEKKIKC